VVPRQILENNRVTPSLLVLADHGNWRFFNLKAVELEI